MEEDSRKAIQLEQNSVKVNSYALALVFFKIK